MQKSTAITNFPIRLALVSMCVLSFEGCALVRQRTKRESQTQELSLAQRRLTAITFSDSLASRLDIVFDSVEIVVNDSPSPQVKVRATKATISSETNHTVTARELAVSQDTTHTENCIEKCDERSVERSKKPPNRVWAVGIIALTLLAFLLFKKQK